jgi:hypothetical protein
MAKRLLANPKIVRIRASVPFPRMLTSPKTVLWNTVAIECQGDGDLLNNLRIKNTLTGKESDLTVDGLFYAIGTRACMQVLISHDPLQAMNQRRRSSAINCRQTRKDTSLPFQGQLRHPYGVCSPQVMFKTSGIGKLSRALGAVVWPRWKLKG